MAAKSSNLVDEMFEANLQMEGHMDVPSQGVRDLWEPEVLDGSPSPLAILVPSPEATVQLP